MAPFVSLNQKQLTFTPYVVWYSILGKQFIKAFLSENAIEWKKKKAAFIACSYPLWIYAVGQPAILYQKFVKLFYVSPYVNSLG